MSDVATGDGAKTENGETTAVLVEIFDPPMCCPSGLCGPAVDPALLAISEAILSLDREYGSRVRVERYLLSQQVAEFMKYPAVLGRLQQSGTAVLPMTVVNGEIVKERRYPTLEELEACVKDKNGAITDPGSEGGERA